MKSIVDLRELARENAVSIVGKDIDGEFQSILHWCPPLQDSKCPTVVKYNELQITRDLTDLKIASKRGYEAHCLGDSAL